MENNDPFVPASGRPILVVEDDWFTRLIGIVLDPTTSIERYAAFADFFAHDEPDFDGYCQRLRARVGALFPAKVSLVGNLEEMRAQLPDASALVVESLRVGRPELEAGRNLRVVQKFGSTARNIDTQACAERGIKLLTVRRRSSIACAEHAISLILTLARKLHRLAGRISREQLTEDGDPYRPFDRRHTANSNWARVPGIRTLYQSTLGIIGIGEIGHEVVVRLRAFGMRILYYQRSRLPEAEEQDLQVTYAPLEQLLAESDWILPLLPGTPATVHFIDRARFAQMKPGAYLVNISRANVVDRDALIEALQSGRLGGFALDPQYETPGRSDDELLQFRNVVLTPHIAAQPRFNVLSDMSDMMVDLATELARRNTRCTTLSPSHLAYDPTHEGRRSGND
jgi:phosphoglycerate dehydrogenase-like enzyme